jgi:hypothetical protein
MKKCGCPKPLPIWWRRRLPILAAAVLSSCARLSSLNPISGQHPAWAMNSGDCAVLGSVVAPLLGLVPLASAASVFGAIAGNAVCKAESSLVAGPGAQVTVVSTTTTGSTKAVQ